jgi:hypothetical protein
MKWKHPFFLKVDNRVPVTLIGKAVNCLKNTLAMMNQISVEKRGSFPTKG